MTYMRFWEVVTEEEMVDYSAGLITGRAFSIIELSKEGNVLYLLLVSWRWAWFRMHPFDLDTVFRLGIGLKNIIYCLS